MTTATLISGLLLALGGILGLIGAALAKRRFDRDEYHRALQEEIEKQGRATAPFARAIKHLPRLWAAQESVVGQVGLLLVVLGLLLFLAEAIGVLPSEFLERKGPD